MALIITAQRTEISSRGCFSEIFDDSGQHWFWTAERTYLQPDGTYAPKVGADTYECQRGLHTLPTGEQFDTFEVVPIPGHTGILFVHAGNLPQRDSDGCFLAGRALGWVAPPGTTIAQRAVIMSRQVIDGVGKPEGIFSARMRGIDTFTLIVKALPQ